MVVPAVVRVAILVVAGLLYLSVVLGGGVGAGRELMVGY